MTANKIFAALLCALLLVIAVGHISDALVHVEQPEQAAFFIDVSAFEAGADAAATQVAFVLPIANRLAEADASSGQRRVAVCAGCHSFTQGGPASTGPNLWNIVGKEKATTDGFAYSAALRGLDGQWDYEALDAYLASPSGYAPGTNMGFIGVQNDKARADIIAYMRSLSDSPKPLPEPYSEDELLAMQGLTPESEEELEAIDEEIEAEEAGE